MNDILVAIAAAILAVLAQDVAPGRPVYHAGWYNVLIAALIVYALARFRRARRAVPGAAALALLCAGGAIVAFTGVANGLLGPDTQTVIGSPGASIRNGDVNGSFDFPLAQNGSSVVLHRGRSTLAVGPSGRRYSGGFVFWQTPRTVVYVEAFDTHGGHLTITQPTNATFLSPVLLMEQTTSITGMQVPVDTFSVPAVRRVVKAVLFSPQQAAQLHSTPAITGSAAVLFAVSDQNDRILPGGIGIVRNGAVRTLAGLRLRAATGTYPALVVASAPNLPILIAGLLAALAGVVSLAAKSPSRLKS
ncbi:MAG: hypothetical protein M3R35_08005 [Candidatus Eremiobacteraeota bacterium]|nr:hypothetical protein [Candidatus Eremiobacteraeota bacterium]